jgi:hypothetical protein
MKKVVSIHKQVRDMNILERKEILKITSEKHNLKCNCMMDEVLLYLRYLQDEFNYYDSEFVDKLDLAYKTYRSRYAENPAFTGRLGLGNNPAIAFHLFYYCATRTGINVTQVKIADKLSISPTCMMGKARKLFKLLELDGII